MDELLRLITRPAGSPGAGADGVLAWLRTRVDAEAAVVGTDGAVTAATPGFPGEVLARPEPAALLGRLTAGRLASAATGDGPRALRLERIGARAPYRVLAVLWPRPPDRAGAALAARVCGVLDLLFRAGETDAARREYERKARQVRLGVFMALMAGDILLARRMSSGARPPLLDCERLRVHLLRCAPADRDRLARAYQDGAGFHGRALMVRCPVYDEHLICLIPDGEPLAGELRALVGENPAYALGISTDQPLTATAEAYEQARHALAVARTGEDRLAGYEGREPLDRLLPPGPAARWAAALLAPLEPLPGVAVEVTRLALRFPRAGVARLLGLSRTTVTAHLRRVETALGMDLRTVGDRATLHLALALPPGPSPGPPPASSRPAPAPAEPPAAPLAALLATDAARRWARALLRPLAAPEQARVRATVHAWIGANTDVRRTALALGISRTTVTAHLRRAEGLLHRDLSATGAGVHELALALRISVSSPVGDSGQRAQ
ncbi:helix-turn-helix domain-containing protein [Streptomyces harbinensis]|uniref:PucR C-terminal helix-turn-helix domain-containing protein n=1 Tax=Streptomyces harbinensis TaxID=1176198 RepID=A0A1I6W5I6_9ACTN|nr:helix-turn-helix domain-containing protein [Streptomyces harbinensis]SFT21267.1 PucR C-terminal helix-turn-helix domain-containing protein [Streptomyces harbinensis]